MSNEYDLKKEIIELKTNEALKNKFKTLEIINWLNDNTNNHIGFFKHSFKYFLELVNNINDNETFKYVNNCLNKVIKDSDKYFYWYDFDIDEITIMEIDDKYNGLTETILYYVTHLYPNNINDYYKFISDLI